MGRYGRAFVCGLGAFDVLVGLFILLWPGVWQEWAHPLAMGTTFYHLQRVGALWCVRGVLEFWTGAKGHTHYFWLFSVWWLGEAFGDALMGWRTWDTGAWTPLIYGGRTFLDLGVAWLLWRYMGNKLQVHGSKEIV